VADRWTISRADQECLALGSQQKAAKAISGGAFDAQITPVPVERVTWSGTTKNVETLQFKRDELVRARRRREGLAKLKPAFKTNGTVTAGNASPYSDGAAALVLMRRTNADALASSRSRGS